MEKGGMLDPSLADAVAFGMKEWAIEQGATCFTHWFHPLTDKTARKYDAFVTPKHHIGQACHSYQIMSQFTGKQLVQGEPDGSSFPSGGLRRTSEARGYTAWDCTSPAFVVVEEMGGCLYVPAVFCSIFGLSLDTKTPLLKSERAIADATLRMLRLLSDVLAECGLGAGKSEEVFCTVGAEQEVFMVDRDLYLRRPDLVTCGRTLVGMRPPKAQELSDHYWGVMPQRVLTLMKDVQSKLWRLGIPVTTVHNEVAPAQYEMAPVYERASVASDHNMVLMQILAAECERHGLALLLHEKPFANVNGSGKHCNWALSTDSGENLLVPGTDPRHNLQFLCILAAFLCAVKRHGDVLRAYIAVPGNEFRLGGMEAPPAIISVFIGDHLENIIRDIVGGTVSQPSGEGISAAPLLDLGLATLPKLQQDVSDRNRTSPMAFTGNRFEFRAVGSSQNIAGPITAINTVVADSLHHMSDKLEAAFTKPSGGKLAALQSVLRETLQEGLSIVYNGDCYESSYIESFTKERGVPNLSTTPMALRSWDSASNKQLFASLNVMTPAEVEARGRVWAEYYCKVRAIEARCLLDLVSTQIMPAALKHQRALAETSVALASAGIKSAAQAALLVDTSSKIDALLLSVEKLRTALTKAEDHGLPGDEEESMEQLLARAERHHDVLTAMEAVRVPCDALEAVVDKQLWPVPSYADLFRLF
eukprot:TRINITY_DN7856_c0_g1_i1.p1 TRINITY_DN7856_c0_g1~~TRINITY_DN7856_c0_g1_i1.p1  ORF type:complete len:815 (-),score=214.18 TRINITY_DN7856_c0_g1_i1:49-2154(-)